MAIKPDDCIVPYGKLKCWSPYSQGSWDGEWVYKAPYLEKFDKHISQLAKDNRYLQNNDWRFSLTDKLRDQELAKFKAVFKKHKTDSTKSYIKFKSYSALTMFILKWS